MKIKHRFKYIFLFLLGWGILSITATAQTKDSLQHRIDSLRNESEKYVIDTSVSLVIKKTEAVTQIINTIKEILRRGFDTTVLESALPETEMYIQNIQTNYQQNQQLLNLRNLNIIKSILFNYSQQLKKWQEMLIGYTTEMMQINSKLNLIIRDSSFTYLPHDTLISNAYKSQLLIFTEKWGKADSSNKTILLKIENLQTRVANAYLTCSELTNETNYRIKNFSRQLALPEENPIWNSATINKTDGFLLVMERSAKISSRILSFYLMNKRNTIIIILLITLLLAFSTQAVVKKLAKNSPALLQEKAPTITHYPILTTFLIVGALSPFFSQEEPASFTLCIWVLVTALYTYLFTKNKTIQLNTEWWMMILFFVIFSGFNLLIQTTQAERWIHLLLVGASLMLGLSILRKHQQIVIHDGFPVRLMILIFIGLNVLSAIFNVIGSFILAKYFAASAITGLLTARILYSLIDLIMETIWLYEAQYRNSLITDFKADLEALNKKLKTFITGFVGIIWLIILSRNLNVYDIFFDGIADFLMKERILGSMHFSFYSILIFIGIIWISNVIAKSLQLIFGETSNSSSQKDTHSAKGGSILLLARIGILSLGIILAFVASGIPLDKLTIIIGALGVGIGFGLQNVVNNLVSGLILAFERPVRVGDTVEVSNRQGTVKEIGIRSTKIITAEGSEVIIPNGDLLSQHIINWTQNSAYRRVEILVGVGYESSLREVERIILGILNEHAQVQTRPAPLVLTHSFADSSVQIRTLFWTNHENWVATKSDILQVIHQRFQENNIQIPFPQQDIHIIADKIQEGNPNL
ncbi:MAG: mechanosensitive ion channel [Bacteroidetes bacterium]|nr:mechanosensitive ion channel [Bacteroidota bacterium]